MTKRSKRVKVPIEYLLRIAARDRWTCHVCQLGFKSNDLWELDHDIPIARGGTNLMRNLRICHRSCNQEKGAA
jgi:5-methylcytosine-specific restriction endonuclease McrA